MFRLISLTLVVFLVVFSVLYSNASYEQQQKLPEPVRIVANDIRLLIGDTVGFVNSKMGGRLRAGVRRAKAELDIGAAPEGDIVGSDGIFVGQDKTETDFSAQLISKSDFTRATLDGSNMTKTLLSESSFDSASVQNVRFNQTVMTGLSARAADFTGSSFNSADLTGTLAQAAVFRDTNFNAAILSSSQFSSADFTNANMVDIYADRSIFFHATLTGANISNGDFTRANFEKAKIINAVISDSHFERATFAGADLSGSDLSTVTGLVQTQLAGACGDEATKLPEGLTVSPCHAASTADTTATELR